MTVGITATGVLALAAVAAVGVLYLKRKDITEGVKDAAQAINPASDRNIVYRGVNGIGVSVSGDPEFTVGGAVYDLFNADTNRAIKNMLKGDTSKTATSGRITRPPAPVRDSITDLFLDPYGYSSPI